jgi:hypothetical protein
MMPALFGALLIESELDEFAYIQPMTARRVGRRMLPTRYFLSLYHFIGAIITP